MYVEIVLYTLFPCNNSPHGTKEILSKGVNLDTIVPPTNWGPLRSCTLLCCNMLRSQLSEEDNCIALILSPFSGISNNIGIHLLSIY